MGKMVGMAEFKANCTRLLREVQEGGEPITVTSRGKPIATVSTASDKPKRQSLLGVLAGTVTIQGDLDEPLDPKWEKEWEAKWNARGFPVRDDGTANR
ncbi:type II toxin-antitoxin system Phd/YefM family antitoxin [Sphingomonas sp.]|jgi:prevent-host-death family protein|uniref:type II toxin-antitoxin system Phd/YefM family antitoxin n=1 Tax=Sphingomonas sp. TaxID=28214 RepID=UPI002D7F9DCF|nr:type II toxin-antitoxin system Phd/YefM family antitoxin [Sphingomonas sp.]HEU0043927.1 type II toxin-antitoxin system Phd/YefM family antitoxin [Sphingomonas sp.]